MEKAPLPDGLPGSWLAETGRSGASGNERGRSDDADAYYRKFWPGAHSRAGHVRHMALANGHDSRRSEPRRVLETIAALGGHGHARQRGCVRAEPDAFR